MDQSSGGADDANSVALVLRMRSRPVVTDGPVVPYGFGRALDGVAPFPGGGATTVPTIATTVGHFVGSSPWRSAVCLWLHGSPQSDVGRYTVWR